MIVEPDLTNHPKFIQLKSLVGDVAMELLVRLWTHCQQNKRGQFWHGANEDYVEVVCCGRTRKGRFYVPLRDCGWIHEREGGIEIHDWDKHNASLIARWKRDVKPAQNAAQPTTQTSEQHPDRTGQDRTGNDIKGEDGSINNHGGQMTPTLEEAVAWFQKNVSGYTADQVKAAFDSLEATKHPNGWWKFGESMVTDWRAALSSRLALLFGKKNAPGKRRDRWQVEKDLDAVRDAIRLHPKTTWPGNKPLPAAIKAEFEALLTRRTALEAELKGVSA